jgi:Glyoxalase-like domain
MIFWQLTIDANDPARLARFWGQALDYQPTPPSTPTTTWQAHYEARLGSQTAFDDRLFDPAGLRPPIWFQEVPEAKAGKNRLHLDLYPTGRDDTLPFEQRVEIVDRRATELVGLGATVVRRTVDDDPEDPVCFVVMHDPEGNEFCVG